MSKSTQLSPEELVKLASKNLTEVIPKIAKKAKEGDIESQKLLLQYAKEARELSALIEKYSLHMEKVTFSFIPDDPKRSS